MTLTVAAPLTGVVYPLTEVPDSVFSQHMMGPGVALEPDVTARRVFSPVDGVILSLHPHAFVIEAVDGRTILVHLGLDTIEMRGRGFTPHTQVGQIVKQCDLLLEWSPEAVIEAGYNPIVPVIALQAPEPGPRVIPPEGTVVEAGKPLLAWG
jgi:glucose-specific phosphotransferase system IIA component